MLSTAVKEKHAESDELFDHIRAVFDLIEQYNKTDEHRKTALVIPFPRRFQEQRPDQTVP